MHGEEFSHEGYSQNTTSEKEGVPFVTSHCRQMGPSASKNCAVSCLEGRNRKSCWLGCVERENGIQLNRKEVLVVLGRGGCSHCLCINP